MSCLVAMGKVFGHGVGLSFAVVGDAVPGVPHGGRRQGGGREQQTGERMGGTDRGGGPGGALLGCPGRFYEVRHKG
ncbi:hypothetical protein B446_35593 (plasmid) [Streptomyces collinus Tu 365]|uniref:Uncharacterized protein n=1 Tax=Streptomyces collinus (strain DSM 40733 / Tue 365) TaxID=1214242 RepID=S5VSP6_STRC3|nr:hypothetical protein B446_35593 [Streptomyces collinus Tu 365]